MSGDMNTSLGNGFTNLMLTLFIASEKSIDIDGFVEGDDGIWVCSQLPTPRDYLDLGFTIKIEVHDDPREASFCGLIYGASGQIIRNPVRFLQTFGWTGSFIEAGEKTMYELLRAKALSACYETPSCPIVGAVAREALRVTEGYQPRYVDTYHKPPPANYRIPSFEPTPETRELFAKTYGVSTSVQLLAEAEVAAGNLDQALAYILDSATAEASDNSFYCRRFVSEF